MVNALREVDDPSINVTRQQDALGQAVRNGQVAESSPPPICLFDSHPFQMAMPGRLFFSKYRKQFRLGARVCRLHRNQAHPPTSSAARKVKDKQKAQQGVLG